MEAQVTGIIQVDENTKLYALPVVFAVYRVSLTLLEVAP